MSVTSSGWSFIQQLGEGLKDLPVNFHCAALSSTDIVVVISGMVREEVSVKVALAVGDSDAPLPAKPRFPPIEMLKPLV